MRLAAHQPDFLPWPGFWWKMNEADLFDLAVWDQYSSSGYHSRVTVGPDRIWLGCAVPRKLNRQKPLADVRFRHAMSRERVLAGLGDVYGGLPFIGRVLEMVAAGFDFVEVDGEGFVNLVRLNVWLIGAVRQWLGITTEMRTAFPLTRPKGQGILQLCDFYGADSYLSGVGGREYLVPDEFEEAGVELEWVTHVPAVRNSIVEVLAMSSEPMEVVCNG